MNKRIIADYRNEVTGPNAGKVQYEGEKEPRFPDGHETQEESKPAPKKTEKKK